MNWFAVWNFWLILFFVSSFGFLCWTMWGLLSTLWEYDKRSTKFGIQVALGLIAASLLVGLIF